MPADYVMDEASADTLRQYVKDGGTVVMTAFSAKVDEHSQWFDTLLPGRLSDLFGLRTSQFYRPATPPEMSFNGQPVKATVPFYEVLEPRTAQTLASFTNVPEKSPAITVNVYGNGRAIYLAVPAQMAMLAPLVRSLYGPLGIGRGPETPAGVYARVVDGRTLYVNTNGSAVAIPIQGSRHGVISGKTYIGSMKLEAHDADLVQ